MFAAKAFACHLWYASELGSARYLTRPLRRFFFSLEPMLHRFCPALGFAGARAFVFLEEDLNLMSDGEEKNVAPARGARAWRRTR